MSASVVRLAPDGTPIVHKERSCVRKEIYRTEREAWFALRKSIRNGNKVHNGGTYQCVVCGFWHTGKRPEVK